MSRSKKIFLFFIILFVVGLLVVSVDIARRTTFPGSKSQLKERIKKQLLGPDTLNDSKEVNHQ